MGMSWTPCNERNFFHQHEASEMISFFMKVNYLLAAIFQKRKLFVTLCDHFLSQFFKNSSFSHIFLQYCGITQLYFDKWNHYPVAGPRTGWYPSWAVNPRLFGLNKQAQPPITLQYVHYTMAGPEQVGTPPGPKNSGTVMGHFIFAVSRIILVKPHFIAKKSCCLWIRM